MAPAPNELLIELRNVFRERFNLSDLSDLCQELGIDIENLPGTSRNEKARELAAYLGRRDMIGKLAVVGPKSYPDVLWLDILRRHNYPLPASDEDGAPASVPQTELDFRDIQRLVPILADHASFLSPGSRKSFLMVAGVDSFVTVNLDGGSQLVARGVLAELNKYGRTKEGDVALGRLLTYLSLDEALPPNKKDVITEITQRYGLA